MKLNLPARVFQVLVGLGLGGLSLVLAFPEPATFTIAMVGMDALFIGISVKDLAQERIPNLITYPIMLAGLVRAILLRDPTFLVYWSVLWLAWSSRFMGAGDAKLLMGMFGLWPDVRLAWTIAVTTLVTGVPYLLIKYRAHWRAALRSLGWRLFTLQLLPTPEDFQKEAVPYAFSFCLAGGVYLWMRFISL
jgi:Flp pilus assembly protein protease CpaA